MQEEGSGQGHSKPCIMFISIVSAYLCHFMVLTSSILLISVHERGLLDFL